MYQFTTELQLQHLQSQMIYIHIFRVLYRYHWCVLYSHVLVKYTRKLFYDCKDLYNLFKTVAKEKILDFIREIGLDYKIWIIYYYIFFKGLST